MCDIEYFRGIKSALRVHIPEFDFVENWQLLKGESNILGSVPKLDGSEIRVVLSCDEGGQLMSKVMCTILRIESVQRYCSNGRMLCHLDMRTSIRVGWTIRQFRSACKTPVNIEFMVYYFFLPFKPPRHLRVFVLVICSGIGIFCEIDVKSF